MANIKLSFGKYKNKRLSKIPTDYLEWCRDKCDVLTDKDRQAIEEELAAREAMAKPEESEPVAGKGQEPAVRAPRMSPLGQTLAGEVRMIFRNLAMKYHPDRGGAPEAMKALNEFHETLQDLLTRTFSGP
jgi:hypothetical protein